MAEYSKDIQKQLQGLGLTEESFGRRSAHADRTVAFETLPRLFSPVSNPDWIMGLQRINNGRRSGNSLPDFVLKFREGFLVPFINIKALWDEKFMDGYKGNVRVNGLTADQVRKQFLVYLDGNWQEESAIMADLLIQGIIVKMCGVFDDNGTLNKSTI